MAAQSKAAPWRITFDGRRLLLKVRSSEDRLTSGVKQILQDESKAAVRRIIEQRLTGPRARPGERKDPGAALGVRSGQLRRSIGFTVQSQRGRALAEVGTIKRTQALVYAAAHEYGKDIKPVRRKWLTIPLKASLTPTGVARWTARELMNGGGGVFRDTWILENDRHELIIYGSKQRGGGFKAVPLFILRKLVRLHKRPFIGPELEPWVGAIRQRTAELLATLMDERGGAGGLV